MKPSTAAHPAGALVISGSDGVGTTHLPFEPGRAMHGEDGDE
jgi:hypothetical protein